MTKLRNLLLAFFLLTPVLSFAQWTEVQKVWNSTAGSGAATTTVSMPSVVAGHTVIASVMFLGTFLSPFTVALTDGNGHNFTQTPSSPCSYGTGQSVWLFYFTNVPAGSMTITATPSVAHGLSVHAIEFVPTPGAVTFDVDSCAVPSTGTTPINTPSITPVKSGVLYAGVIPDPASTGSITGVGGSWTDGTHGIIASDSNNSGDAYQFSATGATTVNWTVSGSSGSGWVAMSMSMVTVIPPSMELKGKVFFKGKVLVK
jgi:hypothetical protein